MVAVVSPEVTGIDAGERVGGEELRAVLGLGVRVRVRSNGEARQGLRIAAIRMGSSR